MAEPIRLDTVVEKVDVYRTEALVTRRATAGLAGRDGRVALEIAGLPLALRDDSLRLALADPDAARLVDLHLGWAPVVREAALRTDAAEQLRDLSRQRVELEVDRDRERARQAFLEALRPQVLEATELPDNLAFGQRHQTDAWLELAAWAGEQLAAARKRVRALGRKRRELLDAIAAARDALAKQSQAEVESLAVLRKLARVELDLGRPVDELELSLSYLVPGARWVPEYELRVFEDRDEAELVLKALVAQRTGEAWDRAELAFSTADLTRSAELPELSSWRIGKVQPPRSTGWRPLPEGLEDLFEAFDRHRGSLPAPAMPAAPGLPESPRLGKAPAAETERSPAPADVSQIVTAAAHRMIAPVSAATAEPEPEPTGAAGRMDDFGANAMDMECDDLAADMPCEEVAAPPPPPSAPPAPQAAMEPEMEMSRSMPAPRASRRARGGKMKKKAVRLEEDAKSMTMAGMVAPGGGAGLADFAEQGAPAPEPAVLDASAEALGYQALRMQGPDDGLRGQLKAASPAERMLDSLSGASEQMRETVRAVPGSAWRQLLGAAGAGLGRLSLPRHAVFVEHSAGHFAVRYPMESLGSIPPDGQLHACTLLRRTGSARRVFRSVPLLDDHVYQIVEFENPLELPLLAGPVRAYRGGDYVVTAPLMTTPPGKALTVNLGVEQGVAVARNLHFEESTEGLFGGDTALIHKVEIEVRSRLSGPVRMEVFERLPVSDDDDVKVELVRATPTATDYEQTERGRPIKGGKRFAFDLPARGVVTCTLEYRITIPSKRVLVGGNRRD